MTFKDREDAGRQLGQALLDLDGRVGRRSRTRPLLRRVPVPRLHDKLDECRCGQ